MGARADLKAIHDYIASDSPRTAKAIAREFHARAALMDSSPRAGRVVPELGDPYLREVPVHSWRLIYRVTEGEVEVIALIHKRRLPAARELRGDPRT